MAIRAIGLIFDVPAWRLFPDLFGVVVTAGSELGEDATVVVGLGVPGINGEAMAPFSDPGRVGSLNEFLQVSLTGDPQRAWF